MDAFIKVDFHTHSRFSPDSLSALEDLIAQARAAGLDRLAITDHNTIAGALLAQQMAPDLVIVGEEVQTTSGELLAFFVTEEVPKGLTPQQALERLRAQGAFISVSHPFDPFRSGWRLDELVGLVHLVDAIETHNGRCWRPAWNRQAHDFAHKYALPGITGSDAHTLPEVGRSHLRLPRFNSAAELREVVHRGESVGRYTSPLARLGSRFAALVRRAG